MTSPLFRGRSSLRYVADNTEDGRPLVLDLSTDPAMVVMSPSTDAKAEEMAAMLNRLNAAELESA